MQCSERALPAGPRRNRAARRLLHNTLVGVTAALALTACKHLDEGSGHVAGWSIIDSNQRHPIIVSTEPARMSVRIARESHGLGPQQRARIVEFLDRYKRRGGGSARLLVGVPSGAPNEVAAMHGLADIRHLVADAGLSESAVVVQAYHDEADPNPPIRISFDRHVAEGPSCGHWSTNLSRTSDNLPYPNLGCAQQRNLAAMIANPADLLGPRAMDPRPGERRDVTWEKFQKGESTGAQKSEEEKVKVKDTN